MCVYSPLNYWKKKLAYSSSAGILRTTRYPHRRLHTASVCVGLQYVFCNLEARATSNDRTWDVELTRCQQPTPTYPHGPTHIYSVYPEPYFKNSRWYENTKARKNVKDRVGKGYREVVQRNCDIKMMIELKKCLFKNTLYEKHPEWNRMKRRKRKYK